MTPVETKNWIPESIAFYSTKSYNTRMVHFAWRVPSFALSTKRLLKIPYSAINDPRWSSMRITSPAISSVELFVSASCQLARRTTIFDNQGITVGTLLNKAIEIVITISAARNDLKKHPPTPSSCFHIFREVQSLRPKLMNDEVPV
jgi:hypothetical protein